ncbi:GntR domain protein [Sphingobium chlorophenolicum L-1]|uniref:GntR domain protein n=2 Tax=Sphingobium chlorophenolicum TaxID=46429 RepID=F6F319_SPHCR|nr:GntR domain protein [Sphingobium chlorophenolicum L-1]
MARSAIDSVTGSAWQAVDTLVREVKEKIATGIWPPGYRLPPERDLAADLGVARNTLRRGLKQLEGEGHIERHVGRGSFVAEQRSDRDLSIEALIARAIDASPADIIEIRVLLEPWAASLAAMRASAQDLVTIRECVEKCQQVTDLSAFAYWDAKFHEAIIASTGNRLLECLFAVVTMSRRQAGWKALDHRPEMLALRPGFEEEHRELYNAISERNMSQAANVARTHLRSVRNAIEGTEASSGDR